MTTRPMIPETDVRVKWDEQVANELSTRWECDHGDAAGAMAAQQCALDAMYARWATVAEAVEFIDTFA